MSDAIPAKSWPEVWHLARQHEATHYNYSRGKVRFRPTLEDPEEIGTPTTLAANDPIRIHFYRETKEDYAEVEGVEVLLTLPTDYFLDLPAGFDEFAPAERAQHVLAQMHKFSAVRWQKQMDAAERILWGHIEYLQRTIDQKNQLIASLQKKVDELMNSRGVSNLYDFLVHPNAQNAIETIGRVVSRPAPEHEAEAQPLPLDDPRVRNLVERALESPEILKKLESLAKR
jgi:hypothetical protein